MPEHDELIARSSEYIRNVCIAYGREALPEPYWTIASLIDALRAADARIAELDGLLREADQALTDSTHPNSHRSTTSCAHCALQRRMRAAIDLARKEPTP